MSRSLWYVVAYLVWSSVALGSDEGIPPKRLASLKAATVYIEVEGRSSAGTGSGFLVHVEGDVGYVATNRHVATIGSGRSNPQQLSVVFGSGAGEERTLRAEVAGLDPEQDLAVLKVKARNLPTPLDLTPTGDLHETMTVYTLGFPLGNLLSPTRSNPAVTIGKGTVSSLRSDASGRLTLVQLDGELNPGNSGGPVVTADGKLLGVAVAKIAGTRIGFAIPAAQLNELLHGRAAAAVIRSGRVEDGTASLEIEVPIVDPLNRLKRIELRQVRKDLVQQMLQADRQGKWPDLPGAEKILLRREGNRAVARLALRGPDKKLFRYLFQVVFTDDTGKETATQPVEQEIDFARTGLVRTEAAAGRWQTVTSKEGGFTVDLPVKPTLSLSRSRRAGGRTFKMFLMGCKTDRGAYLVFRIDMPFPLARGAVESMLDEQRDAFAEEWNGRVLTEKRVLAQGNPGRDFTIRGNPEDLGEATIRVRQYLVGGSTVFAVAVLSPPEGELPDDAGRFLGSLALGEAKIRATGTPEPEPKGTEIPSWGLAIDQDRDCRFTPGDRSLKIDVPAAMHDLGGPLHRVNAPRVMRAVNGDFQITVKVEGEFRPGPRSTNPRSIPYIAGGLLVWSDSDNFIRLERAAMLRGGRVISTIAFLEQEGGYGGAVHNVGVPAGDCYLRLERKGSRIHGAISQDGSTWKNLKPIDTVWPNKLKVGLMALSTSSSPFAVNFEELELQAK
jgi:S1-C subfamily serine protease/regulation of enolase protein 1 (concanavalin A-like superfamily)